ncbi:MAG TPA: hypothetical protein PLN21_09865 [Gemmatales bacterium]|nr:hypothetical protein [Gemmatales bacterium]
MHPLIMTLMLLQSSHFPTNKPNVRCTLTAPRNCLIGNVPYLDVNLDNLTNDRIYLVVRHEYLPYPRCQLEITTPLGTRANYPNRWACVSIDLSEWHFVHVEPQGKLNPYFNPRFKGEQTGHVRDHQLVPWNFLIPGEYRFRFVYSTASHDLKDWHGSYPDADPVMLNKFKRMPKVKVISNEIRIFFFAPIFLF